MKNVQIPAEIIWDGTLGRDMGHGLGLSFLHY